MHGGQQQTRAPWDSGQMAPLNDRFTANMTLRCRFSFFCSSCSICSNTNTDTCTVSRHSMSTLDADTCTASRKLNTNSGLVKQRSDIIDNIFFNICCIWMLLLYIHVIPVSDVWNVNYCYCNWFNKWSERRGLKKHTVNVYWWQPSRTGHVIPSSSGRCLKCSTMRMLCHRPKLYGKTKSGSYSSRSLYSAYGKPWQLYQLLYHYIQKVKKARIALNGTYAVSQN